MPMQFFLQSIHLFKVLLDSKSLALKYKMTEKSTQDFVQFLYELNLHRTFQADRGDKSIATKLQCLYVCLTMAQKSRSCHTSWVMLGLICLFGVQSCWPTLFYLFIYIYRERERGISMTLSENSVYLVV